jgi:hypothetical protein
MLMIGGGGEASLIDPVHNWNDVGYVCMYVCNRFLIIL